MNGFEIINPGILTLIQDEGRYDYSHIGLTTSGVMDEFAYNYLNKILENKQNTNVLEICFPTLCLKATQSTTIAITGADLGLTINGKSCPPWSSYKIYKNDVLKFTKSILGLRAYLGVKGGFLIEKEFGSNSTTIKEKLGGISGEALKKSDFLPYEKNESTYTKRLKKEFIPKYENKIQLNVILSYQCDEFEQKEIDKFFSNEFEVSNEANRMGMKLKGAKIKPKISGIISEAIAYGSIQIPSSGEPIILLKDRQTIGGYAKIGAVIALDCYILAQAKAGTKISFKQISIKDAQNKMKKFKNFFS